MYGVATAPVHFNTCGANRPEPLLVYFIYSFLLGIAALVLTPYWLVQGLRHGKIFLEPLLNASVFSYPALKHGTSPQGAILLHAVSVGEVLSGNILSSPIEEGLPTAPTNHFYYYHHRKCFWLTSACLLPCGRVLPVGLVILCPSRFECHQAVPGHHSGNRNLA